MLSSARQLVRHIQPVGVTGQVDAVCGLTVSVSDFPAPVGAGCGIVRGGRSVEARVIGFRGRHTLVMPLGATAGIAPGAQVVYRFSEPTIALGPGMLGRVVDGLGRPVDDGGPLSAHTSTIIWPEPIGPMTRRRITDPLATGVRAIDAMLTVGRGQRMGIFSGSGVGKSVLLGMIGRHTSADVTVIALIGERGREVRDFIERDLGADARQRSVVVVSTSDEPPLMRVQAAAVASAVAEFFRDQGLDVLLLMDSLTRLATAQRQIGLAAGEPPTTKGYTPSVFNLLPRLLERSGRTETGSITGFYSVLVEGDDASEPICDAVRSITDGHIWLSRQLANRGQYPAVDCLQSVSRMMTDVVDEQHHQAARRLRRLLGVYDDIEDMVNIGAYSAGANDEQDLAVAAAGKIRRFLSQRIDEAADLDKTREGLLGLCGELLGPVAVEAAAAETCTQR